MRVKMNPLKLIISPARTGRNILLTRGEMISFNGPGFKSKKQMDVPMHRLSQVMGVPGAAVFAKDMAGRN